MHTRLSLCFLPPFSFPSPPRRCKCGGYWCYKCSGRVEKNVGHTWNRIEGHECGREEVGSASGDDTKRFMFYLNQYRAQVLLPPPPYLPPSFLPSLPSFLPSLGTDQLT